MSDTVKDFSHNHWIKEIKGFLNNIDDITDEDVIKFALSYTLQSLKYGEDFNRFKWRY